MPASSLVSGDARSHSFHSSNSFRSKRSKTLSYRTISRHSNIDENLFGVPLHIKERQCRLMDRNCNNGTESGIVTTRQKLFKPSLLREECEIEKENLSHKKIRHLTSDLIRELVIPSDYVNKKRIIISPEKYRELLQKSKLLTDTEEQTVHEQEKFKREALLEALGKRKQKMREYDLKRVHNEQLTDLEEEARKQAEVLLQKAMEQRQDQEDEIKALNEWILNAKIQAIRDEQILEKRLIKKEMAEEELRLDNMMELERQNAVHIQEEIDRKRKEQEMIGACKILEQIKENEQDRLIELERVEQENILATQRIADEHMKEIVNRENKRKIQEKLRIELNIANEELRKRREIEKEKDRLMDLKIMQIQNEKAEREAAYEAEQIRIKHEKELEIARLRALQERASDEAAERDALRAKRAAEANEREWRRKELLAAQKKIETENELKLARAAQAEDRKRQLAIEAGRERLEFERILKILY
ncbi:Cilia- and flagella-associated protein [Schistosoma japonicum]|nr:Cilia- and flagella-associated protein [Schistosoma japonicum]